MVGPILHTVRFIDTFTSVSLVKMGDTKGEGAKHKSCSKKEKHLT